MKKSAGKLFLLDGMPLIYRAHFVFIRTPRLTSTGQNVSALYGYTNSLLQILEKEKPTHIAVAFDTAEPTQRHREYPEYKAHREAMPEDIKSAIPHVIEITEAFNIPVLRCPGHEADDIIGTLARYADEDGIETYMVTPDKDFAQLVSDRVRLYKPGRGGGPPEIMGVAEILEHWKIERVEQVIDILGLAGDASDNIPGIPGIGMKTAQKLLARFGSVERVLACSGELKGKQKEKVEAFADQARLAKRLVTINRDVPLDVSLDDLVRKAPDADRLQTLFARFEFQTLGRRVLGESFKVTEPGVQLTLGLDDEPEVKQESEDNSHAAAAPAPNSIENVDHTYELVDTADKRAVLIQRLQKQKSFAFDIETTQLDVKHAQIVGFAFSLQVHTGCFVPFPEDQSDSNELLAEFRPLFEDAENELTGHNLKYDLSVLRWHGVEVRCRLFDTMLAHAVLEPDARHGLDTLAESLLRYQPIALTSLIGKKGPQQKSVREIPLDQLAEYAAEDADIALQLREALEPRLKEKENDAERVYYEVELPLVPALVAMEHEGVTLNTRALNEYSREMAQEMTALEQKIYELAGTQFNLNSPKQLGEVLFDIMKLDARPKRTRTGQYITDEQTLRRLAAKHEIIRAVLDYRLVTKLKSTYVDALPNAVCEKTGRVHTTYNQAVTATGRLQSQSPNLQNIPIRTEKGREIRKAFVPRGDEYALLSADYSQIELRIIAELSRDEDMLRAFQNEVDIHRETAAKVYGVAFADVTDEMRRNAKMVNFGIIYGISAFGLAQRLGISRGEAGKIIEQYFEQYTGVKAYIDRTIASARELGYVQTLMGRRRYLRGIDSRNATTRGAEERNAINTPIQGTAADMIKIAMSKIHQCLAAGGYRTRMLMQVHDELVFDLFKKEKDDVLPLIEDAMRTAIPMTVPIVVEMGMGANWLEAH